MARSSDLTVQEVAKELKMSEKTIRSLIRSNELKAYKPGLRAYRVKPEWLEMFKHSRHS